jgi:hypothetical protein
MERRGMKEREKRKKKNKNKKKKIEFSSMMFTALPKSMM